SLSLTGTTSVAVSGPAGSSLTATFTNPDGTPASISANCEALAQTPTSTTTPVPPTVTPTASPTPAGDRVITIQLALCGRSNPNTRSCNGNDRTLDGYTVRFDIY